MVRAFRLHRLEREQNADEMTTARLLEAAQRVARSGVEVEGRECVAPISGGA
jgi:hypothetical protein